MQTLEVALRNSISNILTDRLGGDWHKLDTRGRLFSREDLKRLDDAIARQCYERKTSYVTADMVVADLSFGFWCSVLTQHYVVPLGWGGKNLRRAFPCLPAGLSLHSVRR